MKTMTNRQPDNKGRSPSLVRRLIAPVAAASILLSGGVIGAAPVMAASTPPDGNIASVTVKVGGDRHPDGTVGGLAEVKLSLFTNKAGTRGKVDEPGALINPDWGYSNCISDDVGDCTFSIPTRAAGASPSADGIPEGYKFWVGQTGDSPEGWYSNKALRVGHYGPTPSRSEGYRFQFTSSLKGGKAYTSEKDFMWVYGTDGDFNDGASSLDLYKRSTGVWQQSRNNPEYPQKCGINYGLVVDVSGSMVDPVQGGVVKPGGLTEAKKLLDSFADMHAGTASTASIFSYEDASPGKFASNHPKPFTFTSAEGITEFKAAYKDWKVGAGTNWDQGFSAAAKSGQKFDVVINITDGNPTVFGSPLKGTSSTNSFGDVESSIFSANQLKAMGTRVISLGFSPEFAGTQYSDLNLAATTGPTEGSDYFMAAGYEEALSILKSLPKPLCDGEIEAKKMNVPWDGGISDAVEAPEGWRFDATSEQPEILKIPGVQSAVITDTSGGKVGFPLQFLEGSKTGNVSLRETQQDGHEIIQQNGQNASCVNKVDGSTVSTVNADLPGKPGVTVQAQIKAPVLCTFYNRAPRVIEPVEPVSPTMVPAAVCGAEATVNIPETKGVEYVENREGNKSTITANAIEGYKLAEGARSVWTFEIPPIEPCAVEVTPVIPELVSAETCGVEATVSIPETEGVEYTSQRFGNRVIVETKVKNGYVLAKGAQTEWALTIPKVEPCDEVVTPVAPSIVSAETCGIEDAVHIPKTDGIKYTQEREGDKITVSATAEAGFVLTEGAGATWTFVLDDILACDKPVIPMAPTVVPTSVCGIEDTVSISATEGVVYTQERDGNKVTVIAETESGFVMAEGAKSSWEFVIPPVVDCVETVTPIYPSMVPAETCGTEDTVHIPKTEGVEYTESRVGNNIIVRAETLDGFVFIEGSVDEWEFALAAIVDCDEAVVPIAPALVSAENCGVEDSITVPKTKGVKYTETRAGNLVTITAEVEDGFIFTEDAVTLWEFTLAEALPCDVVATPVAPEVLQAVCTAEGGIVDPSILWAETEGVVYALTGESKAGQTIHVMSTLEKGFAFGKDLSGDWTIAKDGRSATASIVFDAIDCLTPLEPDTSVEPTQEPEVTAPVVPNVNDIKPELAQPAEAGDDPTALVKTGATSLIIGAAGLLILGVGAGFIMLSRRKEQGDS